MPLIREIDFNPTEYKTQSNQCNSACVNKDSPCKDMNLKRSIAAISSSSSSQGNDCNENKITARHCRTTKVSSK